MRSTVLKRAVQSISAVTAILAFASQANADQTQRVTVNQAGDFALIGNTLGFDCTAPVPTAADTTVKNGSCSSQSAFTSDTSPDLYWRSDETSATADIAFTADQARSTAVLNLPTGATVTHAFLYWGAQNVTQTAGTTATIDRPGAGGFAAETITATKSYVPAVATNIYESVADITTLVQTNGNGAYRVGGIAMVPFANVQDPSAYGAWSMVVFYKHAGDPLRNLTLFDGLDIVQTAKPTTVTLKGFNVPSAGKSGKLGVIAYEGDAAVVGDHLSFNGVQLTDANNPIDNFFNGSRSTLGVAVSNAGDLPQLSGLQGSMAGVDLDVVDVTNQLTVNETQAVITADSVDESYYMGAFVTSIATLEPDFNTSTKTAANAASTAYFLEGDTITYTITASNTGNDDSTLTSMVDVLPTEVTYVANSIKIDGNAQSDTPANDEAEYTAATHTVTARLGSSAGPLLGGNVAQGKSTVVTFQAKLNAGVIGPVANQAAITFSGKSGLPATTVLTDGNGAAAGNPPTSITVDQCETNAQCSKPTPVCDTTADPKVCAACLVDSDCGAKDSGKVCDDSTDTCKDGCRGTGGNGCPDGDECSSKDSSIGTCTPDTTTSSSTAASSSSAGGSGGAATTTTASSSSSTVSTGTSLGGAGGSGGGKTDFTQGHGVFDCSTSITSDEDGGAGFAAVGLAAAALVMGSRRRRS